MWLVTKQTGHPPLHYLEHIHYTYTHLHCMSMQNPKMLFFAIIMMCIQVSIGADCRSVIFENDLGKKRNSWKGQVWIQFLVPLSELKTLGDEFIHVLMIATLEENHSSSLSLKILDQLSQLFRSIIQNSLGSPLHVIIVSDANSKRQIRYNVIDDFDNIFLRYYTVEKRCCCQAQVSSQKTCLDV